MRASKEDIDRFFDYNILTSRRLIYLGSHDYVENEECGTDHFMCEYLIKGISYLESIKYEPIIIYMNNPGGNWYHGIAIYDILKASKCKITVVAFGQAMSMGSIILQAADTRILSPNCCMMIHDGTDELSGTAKNVENWAEQSKKLRKKMYQIYLDRMKYKNKGLTLKRLENMCTNDTIFSAQEAVDIGLADWVLESTQDPFKWEASVERNKRNIGE